MRFITKGGFMKIYLAGGMKSDWQDMVIRSCPEHIYFDPRAHGLDSPEAYTAWDLDHVSKADLVFACFTADNPSGFGMCIEIGYAKSCGKQIILVDEKNLKSWDIVRCCCDYIYNNLQDGITCLQAIRAPQ